MYARAFFMGPGRIRGQKRNHTSSLLTKFPAHEIAHRGVVKLAICAKRDKTKFSCKVLTHETVGSWCWGIRSFESHLERDNLAWSQTHWRCGYSRSLLQSPASSEAPEKGSSSWSRTAQDSTIIRRPSSFQRIEHDNAHASNMIWPKSCMGTSWSAAGGREI